MSWVFVPLNRLFKNRDFLRFMREGARGKDFCPSLMARWQNNNDSICRCKDPHSLQYKEDKRKIEKC